MKSIFKLIYKAIPFKKYLFCVIKHFNLPNSLYQHLHFKGIIKVKCDNSYFLIQHYGYQIENEVFWKGLFGGHEKISMKLWIELCKDSEVIFDIGANTGLFSLVAKSISPSAQVYGFEPVKRVFEKYKKNCEINKFDIKCCDYAISNFNGIASIFDTTDEHTYSVTVNKNLALNTEGMIETEIETKMLSSIIEEFHITKIDLIKIDVETHEPEVLEGMKSYLQKFKPTILIEILTDDIGDKVQKIVEGMGYLYFNIDEVTVPKKVDKITKSGYFNYLICLPDVAKKIKLI